MYSYGSPHMAAQKQDDQLERTFSSYVRIQVVVLKTYLGRWTIGRSGERGSGISVLPARWWWWWWLSTSHDIIRFSLTQAEKLAGMIINKNGYTVLFLCSSSFFFLCQPDPWHRQFRPKPAVDFKKAKNIHNVKRGL